MEFDKLLQTLMAGGGVAMAAWFASWMLEEFAWWAKLSSKVKQALILAGALALGWGAVAYQSVAPETRAMLARYLEVAVLTVGAWLASQVAHNLNRKRQDE